MVLIELFLIVLLIIAIDKISFNFGLLNDIRVHIDKFKMSYGLDLIVHILIFTCLINKFLKFFIYDIFLIKYI